MDGRDSIPDKRKSFLSIPQRPDRLWGPTSLLYNRYQGLFLFLEVKLPDFEADHSPPSSAEVKNGGAILPLPYKSSWRGAELITHRDNFTFLRVISVM
jgi:hypothetical protein